MISKLIQRIRRAISSTEKFPGYKVEIKKGSVYNTHEQQRWQKGVLWPKE